MVVRGRLLVYISCVSMTIRIAINGLGRIGRSALKIALEKPNLEVAAVNDLAPAAVLAHLLKYDSVYGTYEKEVQHAPTYLSVAGKKIQVLSEKEPQKLPWKKLGIDVVLECSGRFTKREDAVKHLAAGAKRVILSANSAEADVSIVLGVNEKTYDPLRHAVIANCSCTTNCAAPVIKVLHENFGVEKAQMVTVHAVTASQSLVDGPKEDLREGRAAFVNIVPGETGAARAVVRVIPELVGRFSGSAFRVPVLCGSVLEIVAQVKRETTAAAVNEAFKKAAAGELKGILAVSSEGLVSSDILRTPFSAIVDLPLTEVLDQPQVKDENLVKVVAWYDNEWGYANRLVELAEKVGK